LSNKTAEASITELADHLDEAAADVERALAALRDAELPDRPGPRLRIEYPLAAPGADGTLVLGYADLVAMRGDEAVVIDFKTDQPPSGPVEHTHPEYVAQVLAYVRLLAAGGAVAEDANPLRTPLHRRRYRPVDPALIRSQHRSVRTSSRSSQQTIEKLLEILVDAMSSRRRDA
jgi:hypothetical protein